MTTMRAMLIDGPGGPEVLSRGTCERPVAVNSEFLVRVVAAGVTPIDATTRAGRGVTAAIGAYPAVLGVDFSGVVVSTPYEGHPIKVGDEVYGMTGFPRFGGSYADYVAVSSLSVARKPRALSHVEAAAVPLAALTAWGMVVEVAKAHEGQRMLIHAEAGGVGHFAVQFARFFGAHVIATGSARNTGWLRELGAHQTVDRASSRFADVVDEVDVVIDLADDERDDAGSRSLGVLRHGGLIITAPTGGRLGVLDEAAAAGVRATTFTAAADGERLAVITRLLESNDVRVFVDRVFGMDAAADAHRELEIGHTRGAIVLAASDY